MTGRWFYGWAVVGAVFVAMATNSGLAFYNASVILSAAVDELGAEVGVVSGATGMFFALGGAISFVLAPWMDRLDMRVFYFGGGVIGAVALYGLRYVDSVVGLYVFFAIFSIGYAMCGLVPGTTLVARWFAVQRPRALSIASTGLSVGGVLITPIVASRIVGDSLAGASPWLSAIWVVGIIPLTLVWVRSKPSDMGLHPDGARPAAGTEQAELPGALFKEARATRYYIWLSGAYALIFLAQVGAIAQLFNHVSERLDDGVATAALSTLAFSSITGRLVGGALVPRVGARRLALVLSVVQAGALVGIALADTRGAMLGAAVVFGLSIGNLLMLQPLLIAEAFGVREYSRIYSFTMLVATLGIGGGPFLLGVMRDAVDYRAAFMTAAVANVLGLIAIVIAGKPTEAQKLWAT